MIITRQDPTSFKLQTGETVLQFRAESGTLELKTGGKQLVMNTPGEYEMEGIMIAAAAEGGRIVYTIRWDDMVIGLGVATSNQSYDVLISPEEDPTIEARLVIPFADKKPPHNAEVADKCTFKKKELPPEGKSKTIWLTPH